MAGVAQKLPASQPAGWLSCSTVAMRQLVPLGPPHPPHSHLPFFKAIDPPHLSAHLFAFVCLVHCAVDVMRRAWKRAAEMRWRCTSKTLGRRRKKKKPRSLSLPQFFSITAKQVLILPLLPSSLHFHCLSHPISFLNCTSLHFSFTFCSAFVIDR